MENIATPPPMTFEQAMAIIEKKNEATYAQIAEDRKKHDEEMRKRDEEMRKRSEEFKEEMKIYKEESQKKLEESRKEMEEFKNRMDNLSRRFGDLGNRLGEIVEYLVSPNLKEKFDNYGFYFRNATIRQEGQ